MKLLASPASLKGVLEAVDAAAALVEGARRGGREAERCRSPTGEEGLRRCWRGARRRPGTRRSCRIRSDGRSRRGGSCFPTGQRWSRRRRRSGWRGSAPDELDPMRASSRGLGELVHAALEAGPDALLVCLGDTATVDGGAGFMEVLGGFPVPVRAACDVRNPLLGPRGAARAFGPQKGATPEQVEELEARLAARRSLRRVASLPGAGAAGGLGAALAALGAELVSGAELVLGLIGFRERARAAASSSPVRERSTRGRSRGRLPAPRCASVARRASVARSSAAGSWSSFRARSYTSSAAIPRVRARTWSPLAGCWRTRCRAPRAAVWRAPGAASTRCANCPRRADGTPRRSVRSTSGRCPQ